MFNFQLRPEVRKELKNPDLFIKGQEKLYWGILLAMCSVVLMLILLFKDPEKVLHPTWLMGVGWALILWGLWQRRHAVKYPPKEAKQDSPN